MCVIISRDFPCFIAVAHVLLFFCSKFYFSENAENVYCKTAKNVFIYFFSK